MYARCVFANPLNPVICPILAIALYIFSRSYVEEQDVEPALFQGPKQESRYSNVLRTALDQLNEQEASTLGTKKCHIGTHSARKGAVSYLAALPGGPSIISIFLRAGWSLGNTLDRYFFQGQGGDQQVGRAVTGLDTCDTEFASLPPHLPASVLTTITLSDLQTMLPGYDKYPETFTQAVPYLLASLVYHDTFLRGVLSHNHPLFSSPLYTLGYMGKLRGEAVCGKFKSTDPRSNMVCTGVPPYLCQKMDIQQLESSITHLNVNLADHFEKLPHDLKKLLLEQFDINGAVQITREEFRSFMESHAKQQEQWISKVSDDICSKMDRLQPQHILHDPASPLSHGSVDGVLSQHSHNHETNAWPTYYWGGKMRPFPEGWSFPTNISNAWLMWFCGDRAQGVRPLRLIKPQSHVPKSSSHVNHSRCQTLVNVLRQVAIGEGYIQECTTVHALPTNIIVRVGTQSLSIILHYLYGPPTTAYGRRSDRALSTVYHKLLHMKKADDEFPWGDVMNKSSS